MDIQGIAQQLVHTLSERGLTLAVAESITGGQVASSIVGISGASKVLDVGIVAYSNEAKSDILGVDEQVLERYGAVSEATAHAMAYGVREVLQSSLAVSTTGIAGPTGDGMCNEVGRYYIAVTDGENVRVDAHLSTCTTRQAIREEATANALLAVLRMAQHI